MPLIVNMKTVMRCVVFQVCDESRDINDRQCCSSDTMRGRPSGDDADRAQTTVCGESEQKPAADRMLQPSSTQLETPMPDIDELQRLLRAVTDTAISTLATYDDRRAGGARDDQYGLDLLVDGPLVQTLLDHGLGVLSEEAGLIEADRSLIAVVDPVDGSTNASRQIPWFATSISIMDDDGPLVALVENHVSRERFEAVRGSGATRNGVPMRAVEAAPSNEHIVLINGVAPAQRPWAQYRVFGASALDISYVAAGAVDAYIDFDHEAHGVWDYAGALLVCREVGVPIVDAFGRDLIHRDMAERRTPVAAHDQETLETLVELRKAQA